MSLLSPSPNFVRVGRFGGLKTTVRSEGLGVPPYHDPQPQCLAVLMVQEMFPCWGFVDLKEARVLCGPEDVVDLLLICVDHPGFFNLFHVLLFRCLRCLQINATSGSTTSELKAEDMLPRLLTTDICSLRCDGKERRSLLGPRTPEVQPDPGPNLVQLT